MNTAIQCVILLVCAVVCTSATTCLCQRTSKHIRLSLIADVQEFDPDPICNMRKVIAILKNGDLKCLDPQGRFTQAVLKVMEKRRADKAAQMDATTPETTAIGA